MIDVLTDIEDAGRSFADFRHDGKDEVVLMVNNLWDPNLFLIFWTCKDLPRIFVHNNSGGLSEIELLSITEFSVQALEKKRITIARAITGTFQVCPFLLLHRIPCFWREDGEWNAGLTAYSIVDVSQHARILPYSTSPSKSRFFLIANLPRNTEPFGCTVHCYCLEKCSQTDATISSRIHRSVNCCGGGGKSRGCDRRSSK